MKTLRIKIKPSLLIFITIMGYVGYFVSCTQKDQILTTNPVTTTDENTTNLLSIKTTVVPIIDGTIDGAWANVPKLTVTPTVPDPGNGLFTGYSGTQYPLILRSMYDADYVYFLAEITDPTQSVFPAPWYFDPSKSRWAKEPNQNTYDANGKLIRSAYGEDRLAMLWNVDNSTPKFITQTCYASCHVFTPYMDFSVNPAVEKSNANSGNHYTNGAAEKIDMWWGRLGYTSTSDVNLRYMDDNYQDWAGGPDITNLTGGNANGRHVDGIIPDGTKSSTWPNRPNYTVSPPKQGEFSNQQSLPLDGTGSSVNVPIWVLTSGIKTGFILAADTASGAAKKVTGISSTGVLTFADNTQLDPTVGTDYQKTGDAVTGPTAAKAIPTYIGLPLLNGRSDIICAAFYTGSGWVVEFKRAIKTSDALKQDVDFTGFPDTPFGVAVWDNSNYQHGIQPNLLLQFQK